MPLTNCHIIRKSIAQAPLVEILVISQNGLAIEKIVLKTASSFTFSYPEGMDHILVKALEGWLSSYSQGHEMQIPVSVPQSFPEFSKKVLTFLSQMPFGQFLTYQQVAVSLNNPDAARAVGNACGRNPFPLFIPCHRILAQKSFGGFGAGLKVKKELYNFETNLINLNKKLKKAYN